MMGQQDETTIALLLEILDEAIAITTGKEAEGDVADDGVDDGKE